MFGGMMGGGGGGFEGALGHAGVMPWAGGAGGVPGAAHAYFAWTHDARQKVLEKWFAEDHGRKV